MKWLHLIYIFLVASCIQHNSENTEFVAEEHRELEVNYAQGFDLEYTDNFIKIITHSIEGNEYFKDSLCIKTNSNYKFPKEAKTLRKELIFCAQSSTHLAFIDKLNGLASIKGLCGMRYLINDNIRNQLKKNGAKEICMSDQISAEVLLEINPSLVLTYPFGKTEESNYDNIGLTSLFIAEYLESDAIARLEWIKLFGVIFGKEDLANDYFETVKKVYDEDKIEADSAARFIMNLPYDDNWFMPSENSLIVNLLNDAGMTYFYSGQKGTENKLMPKEMVWKDGETAPYWIIIAARPEGFSMHDLIEEEAAYSEFKSVKNQRVIFCNTATKDYFGNGVLEPHLMLKDILFLTEIISDHSPVYFELLK